MSRRPTRSIGEGGRTPHTRTATATILSDRSASEQAREALVLHSLPVGPRRTKNMNKVSETRRKKRSFKLSKPELPDRMQGMINRYVIWLRVKKTKNERKQKKVVDKLAQRAASTPSEKKAPQDPISVPEHTVNQQPNSGYLQGDSLKADSSIDSGVQSNTDSITPKNELESFKMTGERTKLISDEAKSALQPSSTNRIASPDSKHKSNHEPTHEPEFNEEELLTKLQDKKRKLSQMQAEKSQLFGQLKQCLTLEQKRKREKEEKRRRLKAQREQEKAQFEFRKSREELLQSQQQKTSQSNSSPTNSSPSLSQLLSNPSKTRFSQRSISGDSTITTSLLPYGQQTGTMIPRKSAMDSPKRHSSRGGTKTANDFSNNNDNTRDKGYQRALPRSVYDSRGRHNEDVKFGSINRSLSATGGYSSTHSHQHTSSRHYPSSRGLNRHLSQENPAGKGHTAHSFSHRGGHGGVKDEKGRERIHRDRDRKRDRERERDRDPRSGRAWNSRGLATRTHSNRRNCRTSSLHANSPAVSQSPQQQQQQYHQRPPASGYLLHSYHGQHSASSTRSPVASPYPVQDVRHPLHPQNPHKKHNHPRPDSSSGSSYYHPNKRRRPN